MISLSPARPLWRSVERDECSAYCVRVKTPRPVAIGLFALSALLLSGCSPEAAVPSAPPAAEGEALFASDEEALAAAEAAYAEYLDVSNRILENGGVGEEELRPLVSEEVFSNESASFAERRESGWRSIGATKIEGATLQQVSETGNGAEVAAFFCLSYNEVDVVDSQGISVVSPDRPPFASFEAVVVFESAQDWVLERNSYWKARESCD